MLRRSRLGVTTGTLRQEVLDSCIPNPKLNQPERATRKTLLAGELDTQNTPLVELPKLASCPQELRLATTDKPTELSRIGNLSEGEGGQKALRTDGC